MPCSEKFKIVLLGQQTACNIKNPLGQPDGETLQMETVQACWRGSDAEKILTNQRVKESDATCKNLMCTVGTKTYTNSKFHLKGTAKHTCACVWFMFFYQCCMDLCEYSNISKLLLCFDIWICNQLFLICTGWGERVHGVPWPKIESSSECVIKGLSHILLRHVCPPVWAYHCAPGKNKQDPHRLV